MTQAQLAEIIGVEVETVSRIETGAQLPSLERLEEIAAALGLSLALLLTDNLCVDQTLNALLDELPEREREFICAFAMNYVQHWKNGNKRN
ncbi:hypothetical protein DLREEDagrD3_14640 [Denitratisoma sp. agr-D3]